jgi:serpin B
MTASQTYIRDVLHKAVIEVNEQGTVAAAATAVVMTRSLPPPPVRVKLDRPFLFVVYDRPAKTLLFAAKVETV